MECCDYVMLLWMTAGPQDTGISRGGFGFRCENAFASCVIGLEAEG
jgi:hypothetical protein